MFFLLSLVFFENIKIYSTKIAIRIKTGERSYLKRDNKIFEQFDKHADKSPVYFSRISFNWLPALFGLNIDEALILNDVVVAVVVVVEFMWIFKFFDF